MDLIVHSHIVPERFPTIRRRQFTLPCITAAMRPMRR
jgi:hypothetical protein